MIGFSTCRFMIGMRSTETNWCLRQVHTSTSTLCRIRGLLADFTVEVGELVEDEQRASLRVPISLEPSPPVQGALESKNVTLTFDLVYHLWTESDEVDPGFRTVKELEAADVEDAQDLWQFLDCGSDSYTVVSYHHSKVSSASDALSLATSYIEGMPEMKGHEDLIEAISVRNSGPGAGGLWAIVDSNGSVVGSVEEGQAISMCENKLPYYTAPTVKYLNPGGR